MIAEIRHRFDALTERERKMLLGAGIVIVIYVYVAWMLWPLQTWVQNLQHSLQDKQTVLQLMHRAQSLLHKKSVERLSADTVLSVFSTALAEAYYPPSSYQLQQTQRGDVQLTFVSTSYEGFIKWLWGLNQRYAFSIMQCTIKQTPKPGMVEVTVVLSISVLPEDLGFFTMA